MILEYTLKGEKIPHIYEINAIYPVNEDSLAFQVNGNGSVIELKLLKSWCVHNNSYSRVIFTSLSLIPMNKQLEKLKEVMNNDK